MGRVDVALSNAFVRQSPHSRRARPKPYLAACQATPIPSPIPPTKPANRIASALRWERPRGFEVRSRQGRILLQSGGCDEAEEAFAVASDEVPGLTATLEEADAIFARGGGGGGGESPEDEVDGADDNAPLRAVDSFLVRNAPTQVMINDGLLLFSRQRYDEALDRFLEAMDAQREEDERRRSLLLDPDSDRDGDPSSSNLFLETIGIDSDPSLLVPAMNDAALCALYTCRMRDAVSMMESLVRESPSRYLTERLAFNLCTLYELGSDGATSERRKRILQAVAKRFFLHDVGSECFRIN